MSTRKPKVEIPLSFDSLHAYATNVFERIEAWGALQANYAGSELEGLVAQLAVDTSSANDKHVSALNKRQMAEAELAERNSEVDKLLNALRLIRDQGFVEFSENYNMMAEWGFTVVQTAPEAPSPPVDPPVDP